jgi:hypothetical protein
MKNFLHSKRYLFLSVILAMVLTISIFGLFQPESITKIINLQGAGGQVPGALPTPHKSVGTDGLTAGRVPIASTSTLVGDDADFTWNSTTNTLNATNAVIPFITSPTNGGVAFLVAGVDASDEIKSHAHYVCDGTADDVQINAAIAALTAGRTWKETIKGVGTFTLTNHIVLDSYLNFDFGDAIIKPKSGGTVEHDYIYALDEAYVDINVGYVNGGWTDSANSIALKLDGIMYVNVKPFIATQVGWVLQYLGTNRNSTYNTFFDLVGETVINGIKLYSASHPVTNTTFLKGTIYLSSAAAGYGIEFASYTDSNQFPGQWTVVCTKNDAAQVAVIYNTADPDADVQVYENHFGYLNIGTTGASKSIVVNTTFVAHPSYITYRIVGAAPEINYGGQAIFINSQLNSVNLDKYGNGPAVPPDFDINFATVDSVTDTFGGTGALVSTALFTHWLKTGATINSRASTYTPQIIGFNCVNIHQWLLLKIRWPTDRTDSTLLAGVYNGGTSVPPALTDRHVGFKVVNGAIWATNADGTTETATDTGITYGAWQAHKLAVVAVVDLARLDFYVDGVRKAIHTTNIPTDMTSGFVLAQITNEVAADRQVVIQALQGKLSP